MTLTKSKIIESIQNKHELTEKQSAVIVNSILTIIKDTLSSGEDILISGFGKFCIKEKAERRGRNPVTGEDKMLPARRVVTFRCSGKLRRCINSKE